MQALKNLLEKGFYYHYKRNPDIEFDHAYEVVGIARHTEDESLTVLYRPLYETNFIDPANFLIRPLEMFMGEVTVEGKTMKRFQKITDFKIISKLDKVKNQMYGV